MKGLLREICFQMETTTQSTLTEEPVDEPTLSLLTKGLTYATAPRQMPVDIICVAETAEKELPQMIAEEIQQDVAVTLRNSLPLHMNLTGEESDGLHTLMKQKWYFQQTKVMQQ